MTPEDAGPPRTILIVDDVHCENQEGKFDRFEDAVAELKRRATIPWDQAPNQAPCMGWKKCGREYCIEEYDITDPHHWKMVRRVEVLKISSKEIKWADGFERAGNSGENTD
jgi:hypothetical protein